MVVGVVCEDLRGARVCLRWRWELDGRPAPVTQAGMTCGSRYLSLTCILMCDFYEHCATYTSAAVCK